MKTQINLRPPEFTRRHEFYLPRVFKVVFVGFLFFASVAGIFYLGVLHTTLETEVSLLRSEIGYLEKRVEDLRNLETDLDSLKARANFADDLLATSRSWSAYLDLLDNAAEGMVALSRVEALDVSPLFIRGVSEEMSLIVSFARALEGLDFIEKTELAFIERDAEGQFSFQITAELTELVKNEEMPVAEDGLDAQAVE